jgi:hypothetical protein
MSSPSSSSDSKTTSTSSGSSWTGSCIGIGVGEDGIDIGHLSYPRIDNHGDPCTLQRLHLLCYPPWWHSKHDAHSLSPTGMCPSVRPRWRCTPWSSNRCLLEAACARCRRTPQLRPIVTQLWYQSVTPDFKDKMGWNISYMRLEISHTYKPTNYE